MYRRAVRVIGSIGPLERLLASESLDLPDEEDILVCSSRLEDKHWSCKVHVLYDCVVLDRFARVPIWLVKATAREIDEAVAGKGRS